jgi:hypothetical protein
VQYEDRGEVLSAHEYCRKVDYWAHRKYSPEAFLRMLKDLDRAQEAEYWLQSAGTVYMGVVECDREYGGPEEGGWWYDSYTTHFRVSLHPTEVEEALPHVRALAKIIHRERTTVVVSGSLPDYWPEQAPLYE